MHFELLDWIILIIFFAITLGIGIKYAASAGKNLTEFFLGGRKLPWYIAGTSMVATTFAADTPLLVAGIVAQNGISGNWIWWNMVLGGMLTTFFFARYWRRSGVMTEVELIELRYGGKAAKFLRGFKAIYLGVFLNCIILGWVNLAMVKILEGFFGLDPQTSLLFVAIAMIFVAIYSAISGLMGVAVTDAVQFIIAMIGCTILAILVLKSDKIGGLTGLAEKLPAGSLNFFPSLSNNVSNTNVMTIGLGAFFARIGVQWWSSWYPGAEPGGGGYIAQRMMSCKDEKNAVFATLFFQIAHYCIRPWPWILVGLSAIILYPELASNQKELGYVYAMRDFLPNGLRGLLLAAFFAAYMSTISTQLNWGASYLVNDLYSRFITKSENEKSLVKVSRIATIVLMILSLYITSILGTIENAWNFIIECGAGLGLVLILRWYWWRINVWSEIVATIVPFIAYAISIFILKFEFPHSFFFTVSITTISWVLVTFLTKPESNQILQQFYDKVRPAGAWGKFSKESKQSLVAPFVCWIAGIALVYNVLFGIGNILFYNQVYLLINTAIVFLSILILNRFMNQKE
jgi:SSS family solute:Na+ symporter